MIHRENIELPEYVYPRDGWRLVEKRFFPRYLGRAETFFSLSNGYLGMRGNCDEGRPVFQSGTFVNGFYESWPIVYGEEAFGFAKTGQTMVEVPDGKIIKLYVDDEPFHLPTAKLLKFERVLDMKAGLLTRDVLWETPAGKRVSIRSTRLVSFHHRHLAAIAYTVTVENADAPVSISSKLVNHEIEEEEEAAFDDPRKAKGFTGKILMPRKRFAEEERVLLSFITRSSRMSLACGADHLIETRCSFTARTRCADDEGKVTWSIEARKGEPIRIFKFLSYHTSQDAPADELIDRAERTLDRAVAQGFDTLKDEQQEYMDDFWKRSDIEVMGNTAVQQAIRFNLFHLIQAAGRAEGAGIPAKGLTGEGYEGHYFWDAEIYILPFLIYTSPRIAENLLRFRYSMLDKARQRAAEVNQVGALFPWRTINGEEASAYYAAGTAQYHINADIMYAMRKYVDVTGDKEFIHRFGAEMLVETARLWRDLGFYCKRRDGQFCIHGVTGPDEYNTVVDNNTFTNLMARENLWYAAAAVKEMEREAPDLFERLKDRTRLGSSEVDQWQRAADHMLVPYDQEQGIHPQDDGFLDRKPWDFEHTPEENYPLLLHYHPLVIYRHKVIKQADVVLAMFLLGNEFTWEEKKRNFEFYDPITTGDSSLSACIQAIMAAEVGYREKALDYARYAVLMDLADIGGNVRDGLHMASMGGTWMAAVYGLAGLRDFDGVIRFDPRPPMRTEGYRFPLTIRGNRLEVEFDKTKIRYTLVEGKALTIWNRDEEIALTKDAPTAQRSY